MDTPDDLDALLRGIINEQQGEEPKRFLTEEDEQDIQKIVDQVRDGSHNGVFISFSETHLKYVLTNVTANGAIVLLAKIIKRLAERAQESE